MQETAKREWSVINKSEIIIVLVVVGTRNIANTIVDTNSQSETKCSEINMRLIWVYYSTESSYYANMSCTFQLLLGIQILIWHGDCRKLDRKGSMRRHLMFVS